MKSPRHKTDVLIDVLSYNNLFKERLKINTEFRLENNLWDYGENEKN